MSDEEVSIALVRHSTRRIQKSAEGEMGIVRGHKFRSLAVRKKDGSWRDAHGRLLKVVEVIVKF
ncbi:MAG TPA: hypothetical protein VFE51_07200 [Verrucomicrobiae bacterium]|nr:hypothetical protein [Verrucomicrobiae bacterium]